jgi:hypothetical protein
MKKSLIIIYILSLPVQSEYWAKIDYEKLQSESLIKIENISNEPIKCRVSAFNDDVYLELSEEETSVNIPVIKRIRYHDLRLYCKPIKIITKLNPWRINNYRNRIKNNDVFFPIK